MAALKCPRCSKVFEPARPLQPACPACGFTGGGSISTLGRAAAPSRARTPGAPGAQPGPALAAPPAMVGRSRRGAGAIFAWTAAGVMLVAGLATGAWFLLRDAGEARPSKTVVE